jgi:PAS domain S-box-containing protein
LIQTYLLAANLFALTALLLGLGNFSGGSRSWRLLPLFLLVISRSLSLIIYLATSESDQATTASGLAALEIFSTFCLMWVLTDLPGSLPLLWQRLAWLGGFIALFLSVVPLIPGWPIPPQLHSIIITMFGLPLILISLGQLRWTHLAAPLTLALANFLSLLDLGNVSWLMTLLAYGFLIGALHWESLQAYRGRQQASEAMVQEAINLSRERQRLLEVSEIISAVPDLDQSLAHVARSIATVTHADQAAIFMVDIEVEDHVHLAAIYSPERPVPFTNLDQKTVELTHCLPLQTAISKQQQLLLPFHNKNGLDSLYALWNEDRSGPTLIQPLTMQGRSIGALMLGNPVTKRSIGESDQLLCRSLASQIATMVEAYRRYLDLELRAEGMIGGGTEFLTEAMPVSEPQLAVNVTPEPALVPALPDQVTVSSESAHPTSVATTALANSTPPVPIATPPQPTAIEPDFMPEFDEDSGNYLAVLETVDDGIVVSNASGRVQLVNKAAERILGRPRRELLKQPIGTIYGEIDSGEPIEDLVMAFSRRNDPLPTFFESDERAIQGRLIPWRNAEREWLGIIAVFREVTRQVKADRARNDFIAALSRVLRGPLTIIKGYAELITSGIMGDYSPEQIQVQQIIHSNTERVVEVLDNAIQISAQSKHKMLLRFEEVDVVKVTDEVLRKLTPLAQLRQLELVREMKTELPPLVADRKYLSQILENLLSNACRFTPPGGQVTMRAWVQQERQGKLLQSQLLLAVADNGVGIPQTEFKRIFDPFYQLDNQTPGEESGMGMGLAVVKELVEMHDGRVWVESAEGEGSVFQVALPLTKE